VLRDEVDSVFAQIFDLTALNENPAVAGEHRNDDALALIE
jgi:hypothetical protein